MRKFQIGNIHRLISVLVYNCKMFLLFSHRTCRSSGFSHSDEAAATEQLLEALNQGDEASATSTLNLPLFKYLDNDVSISC